MNFVNLTNGIQAIQDHGLIDYRYIRIQSTACEQKRWGYILDSLSDDFMMYAAFGSECVVYDYGANKETPRAIWQGLEWIKFAMFMRWHGVEYLPIRRAFPCREYFSEQYKNLSKPTISRLDYFKRYLNGSLNISSVTKSTCSDGDYAGYVRIAKMACG